MESPSTLKTATAALCLDLKQLEEKLRAQTIAFDDAQRLWDSSYRPKARLLAEAMLSYVPSESPCIMVEFEAGNQRVIKSDAVNCIEAPFSKELAPTRLFTVSNQLNDLMNYLPTEADA